MSQIEKYTVHEEHTFLLYRRHRTVVAYGSGSKPCALLENLWISEPSLGILEKIQCSLI